MAAAGVGVEGTVAGLDELGVTRNGVVGRIEDNEAVFRSSTRGRMEGFDTDPLRTGVRVTTEESNFIFLAASRASTRVAKAIIVRPRMTEAEAIPSLGNVERKITTRKTEMIFLIGRLFICGEDQRQCMSSTF